MSMASNAGAGLGLVLGVPGGIIWALHPAHLERVAKSYADFMSGADAPRMLAFMAEVAAKGPGFIAELTAAAYEVRGDVAIIGISDVLDRRPSSWLAYEGGTDTQSIERAAARAAADPNVKAVLLDIDSPGGNVLGIDDAHRALAELAALKPVVAHTGGMCCSAAYFLASASDGIAASPNAEIGSIGVVASHWDLSQLYAKFGVTKTYITAGKFKRAAAENGPLTETGRDYLQGMVDDYYEAFVQTVAKGRGMDAQAVRDTEARTYIADKARQAGLVDMVGNLSDALALAKDKGRQRMGTPAQAPQAGADGKVILVGVTLEQLEAERPDLLQAIKDKAVVEATAAERARIVGILRLDGDKAATTLSIDTGDTVEAAGMRFYQAEKAKRGDALAQIKAAAPDSPGAEPPKEGDPYAGLTASQKANKLADERAKEKGITLDEARQEIYAENPGLKDKVREDQTRQRG